MLLSNDGSVLAIGAYGNDGNGNFQDMSMYRAGMVPHTYNVDLTLMAKLLMIFLDSQCFSLMMAVC